MLNDAVGFSEIYIVCGRTDLRYGIDSLAGVLRSLGIENPATAGTLYLFCGRKSDRIKGLVWESDGYLLLYKKLVNGSFQWPRNASEVKSFTPKQFRWLMEGLTIEPRKAVKEVCVTDGYQVYHTLEGELEDLEISGCWAHSRRRYDEAVKALPKSEQKMSLAYLALSQIQQIYHEEAELQDVTPAERRKHRQKFIKPLVDAYFNWIRINIDKVMPKSKTYNGMTYSINQEKYLRRFLDDGEIPIDNNAAEQSIRSFCIGKKNWAMCDTINGAKSSAIIYSLVETAKANKLRLYEYFNYLLTEIPEHMDDKNNDFCEKLLPWSAELPAECRK